MIREDAAQHADAYSVLLQKYARTSEKTCSTKQHLYIMQEAKKKTTQRCAHKRRHLMARPATGYTMESHTCSREKSHLTRAGDTRSYAKKPPKSNLFSLFRVCADVSSPSDMQKANHATP